jgi:hypothetical protein
MKTHASLTGYIRSREAGCRAAVEADAQNNNTMAFLLMYGSHVSQ